MKHYNIDTLAIFSYFGMFDVSCVLKMSECTHARTHTCMHARMHAHTHACMHAHTHTHTSHTPFAAWFTVGQVAAVICSLVNDELVVF